LRIYNRRGGDAGAEAGDAAKKGGTGAMSKAMQKKVRDLKLLHSDQNAWMAQRLCTENAQPVRGELVR
jgi:hypothetical protein